MTPEHKALEVATASFIVAGAGGILAVGAIFGFAAFFFAVGFAAIAIGLFLLRSNRGEAAGYALIAAYVAFATGATVVFGFAAAVVMVGCVALVVALIAVHFYYTGGKK